MPVTLRFVERVKPVFAQAGVEMYTFHHLRIGVLQHNQTIFLAPSALLVWKKDLGPILYRHISQFFNYIKACHGNNAHRIVYGVVELGGDRVPTDCKIFASFSLLNNDLLASSLKNYQRLTSVSFQVLRMMMLRITPSWV